MSKNELLEQYIKTVKMMKEAAEKNDIIYKKLDKLYEEQNEAMKDMNNEFNRLMETVNNDTKEKN